MALKTDVITNWWERKLDIGLSHAEADGWERTIKTEVLWDDFKKFISDAPITVQNQFTKTGLMVIFYRMTGATKCRTREGARLIYCARLLSLEDSRDHYGRWRGAA